jgi:PKD repeat protein
VVRYVITPSSGTCAGTPFNLDVTVNPIGQVDQPGNQVLCNGVNTTAVNFTTVNGGGVTTYSWTNSVPGIGLAASGSGNIGVFAATNNGTAPVVATIIVTPTFTNNTVGCAGSTKTFTITVNPTPTLSTTLTPADVCSNTAFSYPAASATAGTTFNWTRATVAGITPAGPTLGTNNPNEILRNITSLPIAVTYQYTLAANGCSNVQNVVVNIRPEPVITAGQNPGACSGNALGYQILLNNFTNPADNVTFTWIQPVLDPIDPGFTGGTARPVPSAANITDVFTNTLGVIGTARYDVTPFKDGCAGTQISVLVSVGSEPVLDPGLNAFACSNVPIGLILKESLGSVAPTHYNIISKTVDAGLTDVGNAVVPNGTAPAAYLSTDRYLNTSGVNKTVTYRVQPILVPNCIGAAVNVVITIRPQPVIFPAQTKTVCSRVIIGKEILLAPPNTPAGTLFNWPVPTISDASVQGTAGVNVVADPAGTFHINDQIHNYSAAPIQATYNVTPTSAFGCVGNMVPVIITINPEPIPMPISGRDKICVTDKNIVYNVSAVGGSTFTWTVDPAVGIKTFDFNTNAILIDAAAVAGSGNIIVTETNSFTCTGDASAMSVQVYAQPVPEPITGNLVVCANSTNIYSVTARAGSTYSWTVPGGAAIMGDPSASTITVIFANVGGTISVRETNAAGCITNHLPSSVTVNPLPTATISGGGTICSGASRNLSVDFTGTGPYTFTYALNGVPQAPVATASDPYTLNVTAAGTYTIVNVTDANCTNNGTGTTTVTFFPLPTGTISGTAEMCRGASSTLTMSFTGTAPYTFTYTDGTTPVTVVGHLTNVYTATVSPVVSTTYTLTSLTDGNTCTGIVSGSAVLSVNLPPVLTLTGTNLICYNISTGAINMAIADGTAPFGFSWTGPSGFTSSSQNISALAAGYYAVVVNDTKGCTGTANITLTQPPVLNGSAAGTNITCFGANDGTITISGASGGTGTYEFTVDGGGIWQAAPVFSSLIPGSYNVMMRDAVNPTCILPLNGALQLTQPTAITAVAAVTSNYNGSQISCNGATDGTLTVTASGGIGVLSYLLNEQPGNLTGSINGIFTGLGAGSYTVRVRDLNLCTVNTAAVLITSPAVVTATALVTSNYNGSQISCIGASDGRITVTAGGGTGALTYILIQIPGNATGSASGIFTGVPAGTYTVRVTDLNGCNVTTAPVTITNPAALTAAGSVTSNYNGSQVSCNGASDGAITIIAGGGTGVRTFVLDQNPGNVTGAASGIFTGLNAGTYTVTVTDINGCTGTTNNIVVSNPSSITASTAITSNYNGSAISCNGALDGRIAVTASGGTGALSYLLIEQPLNVTGAVTGIFTGLGAGSYTVRVTDINLCNLVTAPVILTQPAAVTASTAITSNYNGSAISCNGATDGRITVTASGGTGALSYLLNEQPLNITGSINGIFTGLGAGSYTVRVRDLNLCTVNTVAVLITAPALVTASALVTSNYNGSQVSCNGASDGTITVTAGGGTGALTYLLIQIPGNVTGSASGIFTGVPAGTYTVRVTDLNGCNITTLPVTISNPVVITAPISITSNYNGARISCFGASDGIITVVGAGGTGALSYVLDQDPANVTGAATGVFTGLPAGTYTVTVNDINLCSRTTTSVTLNNPPSISALAAVTSNYNGSQVSCNGSLDGSITVMASGGTGALSYLLVEMPLNVTGAATGIFTGVGAGTYTVRVSDLNSCNVITAPVTISNPPVITATALVTSNYNGRDVSCNGASDGRITVTASGGSGTLTYILNEIPLNVTGLNTGIFSGVPAGAGYTIRVTDKNGCNVNTAPVAIVNPPALTATALVTSNYNGSQVSCNGSSDGVITVTAGGGTGALNYSIIQLPGNLTGIATGVFTSIPAGTYTVRVTDLNGCNITTAPVTITNPAALTAAGSVTSNYNGSQITCNGASDGAITIIAGGGTGVRTFVLDQNPGNVTGAASGIFTGLNVGTYTVTVTDINGCTRTTNNIVVSNPPSITATTAITSNYNGSAISCNGALDGRIAVTASGGTGALSYLLIEQPLNVTGAVTGIFTGLGAGSYTVRVTDINLCNMTTAPVTLTQPAAIAASANVTSNYNGSQLSCNTSTDGRITVTASGGTGALSYLLNEQPLNITGAVSGIFTGLGAGSYTVRVTDLNLCTLNTVAVVITAPAALGITVNKLSNFNGRDISCFGAADGRVEAVVTGGTGSYSYNWYSDAAMTISIGQVTAVALNLSAGTYYVRVRDLNNCTITGSVTLNQPVALDASITAQTNVTCYGGNTGSVTVVANPATGTAPYDYSIDGGGSWSGSGTFSNLNASIYNIIARDANGCLKQVPVTISQLAVLNGIVSKTDVSCAGANDGVISITSPTGGSGTYQYSVDGGISWLPSGNFSNLLPNTYDVRIADVNDPACTAILNPNLIITEPVILGLTSTGDIILGCFGNGDGAGTFFASGGTMPYNFHLVDLTTTGATLAAAGFNSQSFYNAGAGSITIAVTDFHGCFVQATINVTQPAVLTPGIIAANQVVCAGTNPVQITETVPASGGPGAYNYQWQYGTTAAGPFFNIAGANGTLYTPVAGAVSTLYYRRMITSGLCNPVYSNAVEVLVNPRPVAVLTGGETICPAQSSILKVNMMVGTGPFELDVANFGTITGYVSGADIIVSPGVTTVYTLTRVRDANGCEVISPSANLMGTATVTVRALPVITTSPVNRTVCEFGLASFNVVATGTDLTYQWYVNTGSGFNAVADGGVYFGATNSTLSLFGATRLMNGYIFHVDVTGCSSTVTSADVTLTVNTPPEITIQPKDSTICMNANGAFLVTATGTALTYQWQVNTGSGFNNVVDNANFSGSALSTLTITNAQAAFNNYVFRVILNGTCGIPTYSNFAVLRVNVPPVVTLNPVSKAVCDGTGPVIFSGNGSGMIDSLRWQVYDGAVWSDVHDNAIYSGAESQQLTLTAAPIALNGFLYRLQLKAKCTTVNTTSATLTVNPNPVVDFSAIDPIHACGSVPMVINGNPAGGSGVWSSHLWTGDVGPLSNYFIQSPTFNTQLAGSYTLNYRVRDNRGCFGNDDVTVLVDAPDATYTQDLSNGCTPATVTFTKDMTGLDKFWWDFGDGSPRDSVTANPVHTFTNVNTSSIEYFNVILTVRSPGGCLDTYTTSVTVYPSIDATFTATPGIVCSGNQIVFTTLPGASKYFWDFGDGSTGYYTNSTNHLYTNFTTAPVVRTVTLTTTSFYNCTDVKTMNVTVMPVPLPQFVASPATQEYETAGNPVVFTNTTNPGTWNWLWNFGDGSTSTAQSPSHTYLTIGTYNVVLTVSNANCTDSVKHEVRITPKKPIASFDLIPSGCSPWSITPNNTSLYTDTPGTTYMWDFGDGGASTSKNPTYTYFTAGTYTVKLTVSGPGGISTYMQTQLVNAYPSPLANFQVSPTTVFVNDEKVRFFNLTQGADSYLWEFGDGDTSKVSDPFHKYMEEGVYDITLWAYVHNVVNGVTITCSDKFVLSPGVTVEPAGEIRFSTVFRPNKDAEIEMDHLPTGNQIDLFFFPPIREKVINYKLQIFNRLGVLIFETRDINKPWNGYYHNKLCQQGVYVWYVEGKYANGQPFKKVGDVTLLH